METTSTCHPQYTGLGLLFVILNLHSLSLLWATRGSDHDINTRGRKHASQRLTLLRLARSHQGKNLNALILALRLSALLDPGS